MQENAKCDCTVALETLVNLQFEPLLILFIQMRFVSFWPL